jgi:hypothetical protein
MMAAREEELALQRVETLATARRLASEWGYWCYRTNVRTGYEPTINTGGIEKNYKAPPQWHPAEPRPPEANEISGLAVQRAFIRLPQHPYRSILTAEYCMRPWIVPLKEGEVEYWCSRKARVSIGAYDITLDRALLALANVMKRMGMWRW